MLVEFNPQNGHLSFCNPALPGMEINDAIAWVRFRTESGKQKRVYITGLGSSIVEENITDVHGSGKQKVINNPAYPEGIELTYRINTYDQRPFVLAQLSIHNISHDPLYLQEFCLLQARPVFGKKYNRLNHDDLRFFKVGWHGWSYTGMRTSKDTNSRLIPDLLGGLSYTNPVTPRPYFPGDFWSEGWGILADVEKALITGFVSTADQFGQVHAFLRPGQESLSLITQADGIRLDPGENQDSEWGYLQYVLLPDPEPEMDYVNAVSRQMKARVPASPPPPMWTHWYRYYHDITEQLFLQNLDGLAGKRAVVPFQTVELDDGYQAAWGDWTITNGRFPHGLNHVATEITSKGFTAGLWLAPFAVQSKSKIAQEHPDWLVKNKHGKPANAGFLYNMFIQSLDLTHPAVLEHLDGLIDRVCHQWGFGMLKLDFLNCATMPGKRHNPKLTRAQALRAGLEVIRQAAGEDEFLLGSGCPFGPAIGIVDAMRIGPDTAPSWEPFFHWLPWAGPLITKDPSIPSLRNSLRNSLNLSSLHQRWWWNDPDCLIVRDTETSLTEPEVQSAVTIVGLSGGMLVSSDDFRSLNPERLRWASALVPNLSLRGLPVGCLKQEMPEIYSLKQQNENQVWHTVALFNWSDKSSDRHLQFDCLGFESGVGLHVFDFWSRRYLRTTDSLFNFQEIPPHGCKFLRVSVVGVPPQLVGDTLHISQGAEIASWRVADGILSIDTIDLGRWVEGELWLWLPREPGLATCNGDVIHVEAKSEGIYALNLSFLGQARIELIL